MPKSALQSYGEVNTISCVKHKSLVEACQAKTKRVLHCAHGCGAHVSGDEKPNWFMICPKHIVCLECHIGVSANRKGGCPVRGCCLEAFPKPKPCPVVNELAECCFEYDRALKSVVNDFANATDVNQPIAHAPLELEDKSDDSSSPKPAAPAKPGSKSGSKRPVVEDDLSDIDDDRPLSKAAKKKPAAQSLHGGAAAPAAPAPAATKKSAPAPKKTAPVAAASKPAPTLAKKTPAKPSAAAARPIHSISEEDRERLRAENAAREAAKKKKAEAAAKRQKAKEEKAEQLRLTKEAKAKEEAARAKEASDREAELQGVRSLLDSEGGSQGDSRTDCQA